MPVLHRFPTHRALAHPLAHHHGADRGGRGFGQLGARLVGHVGALVQFGLARGEVHGKRKAGGNPALLAVGLRQELENLNPG